MRFFQKEMSKWSITSVYHVIFATLYFRYNGTSKADKSYMKNEISQSANITKTTVLLLLSLVNIKNTLITRGSNYLEQNILKSFQKI